MITLQKSFSYADDGSVPPVDEADINVAFPQYAFGDTLSVAGQESVDFEQQLSSNNYSVAIPTSALFGTDYGRTVAKYFLSLLTDNRKIRLQEISTTFSFSYGGDTTTKVDVDALYFLQLLSRRSSEETRPRIFAEVAPRTVDQADLVDKNIFAVNKTVYLELLNSLFPGIASENESILLYIINVLVDLTGSSPALATSPNADLVKGVLNRFEWEPDDAAVIARTVTSNFSRIFDFPIHLPEVTLLKIAGVVRIKGDNVPFSDFTLCNLSAELSTAGVPHVDRYQWDQQDFDDGQVDFTFPEKYLQSSIKGSVSIKVTAYDNTTLYYAEFKPSDPTLQRLDIIIVPKRPSTLTPTPVTPVRPTKLRGQIVSLAPKPPETLQGVVVIQGKASTEGSWTTLATATSDRVGNFSMLYPSGKYVSAQALVSLDPESITAIAVNDNLISSNFIYILLRDLGTEPDQKKDDCKCEQKTTTGRLPSQDDLIHSDEFTQDIGGNCLNLNTPNRTLNEYNYQAIVRTSDPDVANYSVRSVTDETGSRTFLMANKGKINRGFIDLDNPIRWQDDEDDAHVNSAFGGRPIFRNPAFTNFPGVFNRKPEISTQLYQAVTVATGHLLHYKSEFKADGYSLGDLLYSVPLAPGQKKQIVIFDSSHTFSGSEDQSVSQADSLANTLLSERSVVDQIAGNIGEASRGQSDASTWGVSGAVGASGSSGFIGASAGVAGGYSNANSSASQDSSRNLSQYFGEQLKQSLSQNASDYRKLTASAVTTVKEGQQYNAETTVISNHNHCHSLTMMYFEVLRHFAVFQELVDVEECVFVPFLMTKFSNLNVSKWADVLVTKLLPLHSNTYLTPYTHPNNSIQHPLVPAFDAIERIRTKYSMVDYPEGAYDQEPIRQVQGNFVVHVELPRPKTNYDFIMSLPVVTKTVSHEETDAGDIVKSAVVAVFNPFSLFSGPQTHTVTEEIQVKKQIFDSFMTLDANYESVPPAQCIRINNFATFNISGIFSGTLNPIHLLGMSPEDHELWRAYAHCLEYAPGDLGVLKMMNDYFKGRLLSEWDAIYQSEIAPRAFKFMVKTVKMDVIPGTNTVDSKYNGGERYMNVTFNGNPSAAKRALVQGINISCSDIIIQQIKESVVFNIESLRLAYSTNHFHGLLYNGNINADLLDGKVYIDTPENWEEKRDPRKEDIFIANRLIDHLNFNLEYYNRVLWYSLDTERRWLLLDGFKIEIFDKQGNPEQPPYRSLSSVIKNNLIAVTGNSLVFPVSPGFRVNRALIVADDEQGESLLDYYSPILPTPPYRLSVPTRGVYGESVMGICDSCEKVKPDSAQDWTRFPTDEPTQIATVTPPVPTITPYQAAFEKLSNPLINIQAAPSAPDPGAGLAAATDLLGKAGIFKDITGLDANQANAIKTYLSNNENVRAIAGMASGLAGQAHNTANSAQIMDTMAAANANGVLTNGDYSKLVKQHLQQQIDGGASLNADLENQKAAISPSLEDAAVQAVKDGKGVKAVKTDSDGNTHSIDVQPTTMLGFAVGDQDGGAGGGNTTFNVGDAETKMVNTFKDVFRDAGNTDTPPILLNGQFQITAPLWLDIQKIMDDSLQANANSGLQDIWNAIKDDAEAPYKAENTNKIKDYITAQSLGTQHPNIVKLFTTTAGDLDAIKKLYHDFWTPATFQPAPKVANPTFNKLQVAYKYEADKCGSSVALLGRKFVTKASGQDRNPKPLDTVIPGKLDPPTLPAGSTKIQTMQYTSISALNAAVDGVKTSLDTYKRPVVAGVHSGLNRAGVGVQTNTAFTQTNPVPEHYILIFAHLDDKFLFWDSDDTVSDIKDSNLNWGQAFGVLFFRNGRFTTAFSDEDLNKVNSGGDHELVQRRHRYQVNYVKNVYKVDGV